MWPVARSKCAYDLKVIVSYEIVVAGNIAVKCVNFTVSRVNMWIAVDITALCCYCNNNKDNNNNNNVDDDDDDDDNTDNEKSKSIKDNDEDNNTNTEKVVL